jgi:hypothetical protein
MKRRKYNTRSKPYREEYQLGEWRTLNDEYLDTLHKLNEQDGDKTVAVYIRETDLLMCAKSYMVLAVRKYATSSILLIRGEKWHKFAIAQKGKDALVDRAARRVEADGTRRCVQGWHTITSVC